MRLCEMSKLTTHLQRGSSKDTYTWNWQKQRFGSHKACLCKEKFRNAALMLTTLCCGDCHSSTVSTDGLLRLITHAQRLDTWVPSFLDRQNWTAGDPSHAPKCKTCTKYTPGKKRANFTKADVPTLCNMCKCST